MGPTTVRDSKRNVELCCCAVTDRSPPLSVRMHACVYVYVYMYSIFFAIGIDHLDVMQLLLDYGSDVNHCNNKKNTPLHIACALQNKRAAKVLIEHGANIQAENWQYQKPHEMVIERDKVSPMQAYLNACVEAYQEKVANKEIFKEVTKEQRAYYRSMFDITDTSEYTVRERMRYSENVHIVVAAADIPPLLSFFPSQIRSALFATRRSIVCSTRCHSTAAVQ